MQSPEYARQPRRPVCMLPVVSHLLCSVSSAPVCDCCRRCCQMSCPSGTDCVQPDQLCNGKQDCTDGSDEDPTFCATFNCSADGRVGRALKEVENEEAPAPVGVVCYHCASFLPVFCRPLIYTVDSVQMNCFRCTCYLIHPWERLCVHVCMCVGACVEYHLCAIRSAAPLALDV